MAMKPGFAGVLALALAGTVVTQSAPPNYAVPNVTGLSDPVVHMSRGGSTVCVSGTVTVNASTKDNVKYDYQAPTNQTEVTQTFLSLFSPGINFLKSITAGTQSVSGSYDIGASLCFPANKSSTVQILTHGIGFDRYYWDFAPGYSYVDVAAAAGYTTFLYDRLGDGTSSKADPLNTIQSPLELEILASLAKKLRQGYFTSPGYSKLVGVGHSFGSALTQGLTAAYPKSVDAAILTGWSTNISGMPGFSLGQNPTVASADDPSRFGNLSAAYLTIGTEVSVQNTFFHAPGFDPKILALANATKATTTIGEYLTTGNIVKPAANFTGLLALVAGNEDLAFCNGDCSYPSNLLARVQPQLYPGVAASNSTTYRVPNTGHGLNLHYSATMAFEFIQSFLTKHGL